MDRGGPRPLWTGSEARCPAIILFVCELTPIYTWRRSDMPHRSSWRSSADYVYLNELTPAGYAWKFLRRNPKCIQDYQRALRQKGSVFVAGRRWELPSTHLRRRGQTDAHCIASFRSFENLRELRHIRSFASICTLAYPKLRLRRFGA
jgi:hypothetical protein